MLEPFASLGANWALLGMRSLDRRTLDAAFWLSLAGGVAVAAVVALSSPLLAYGFGLPVLGPLVAVGALKLVGVGLSAVPQQRLARALRHRELAAANAVATVLSAIARVGFAAAGAGAWSFVLSQNVHALSLLVCLHLLAPMRPRLRFDLGRMRGLVQLGMPTSLGTAVMQSARNIDYLFVASFLGLKALGLYRVAFDLAMEPVVAIGDVIAKSAAPTLTRLARARGRGSARRSPTQSSSRSASPYPSQLACSCSRPRC